MRRRAGIPLIAALFCLPAAGCGIGPVKDAPRAQSAAAQVEELLLAAGEEPGFTPEWPVYVETGPGFVSRTIRRLSGPGGTMGETNVYMFSSSASAEQWLARDTDLDALRANIPASEISRFHVPGVPGAVGTSFSSPEGAQVHWVQGRCVLTLLNEGAGTEAEPLASAAKAIYERTQGACGLSRPTAPSMLSAAAEPSIARR